MKDQIFSQKLGQIARFEFNEQVANVFDDMLTRSIPYYQEIHQVLFDLFLQVPSELWRDRAIYDLGCSTGETLSFLASKALERKIKASFIGLDSSQAMIKKAQEKRELLPHNEGLEFHCSDIRSFDPSIWKKPAQMIIMNYTLQFIPMEDRDDLLKNICDKLAPGGFFILAEKVISPGKQINGLMNELYYDFKRRNGYSELEVAQKREALEKVLVPISPSRQLATLRESGFSQADVIFRWYNFAAYLAIKDS